jgi:nitroimidazol reductase NimA-like FMN-containing flavoprotein (pyridoxamine 5'-phosphate oxidase superfamily)
MDVMQEDQAGMRRSDRQVDSREEIDAIIRGSEVCRLALSLNDLPYLVPVSFGYDGEAIYIHTARTGKKIDYFEANNRVCFEFERNVRFVQGGPQPCDATFSYESVIGYGTIDELVDPELKTHALAQVTGQYSDDARDLAGVRLDNVRTWKISIDSLTAKRSLAKEADNQV